MTTQLLATELANLIQESKRKHSDLRQAAEKSLEELKSLSNSSDQSALEELAQKHNFANPFIIACGTKNAKFTEIAIVCLQRLIVAKALPRSRVNQVLEALMQASSAGLDVQLKILQALPSLLQNYASDLKGNLLVTALNICFVLQGSKNAIVNNTAAATLQQLVVTVFDKVLAEDKNGTDSPSAGVAPTRDGEVELRPAALDAYRVFNDLCLLTENQRPEFLRFSGLPQTFGLELIESVINNHAPVFKTHPEQAEILRSRVMPLLISAFKGKSNFATTVRLVRVLYTLLRRHINILPGECGEALEVLTQLLDHDTSTWKRSLCMEVFRGVFAEYALLRRIYALYDAQEGQRDIIKTLTATFVRLSTEKPAVIGLGNSSTLPTAVQDMSHNSSDQAILEATGMTGVVGASAGPETLTTGISTQWSSVRVPCIDQLDKTEPPSIPESYVYSLVLSCISSLSDGLAKFILPLTVPNEAKNRKKTSKQDSIQSTESQAPSEKNTPHTRASVDRSVSFKKNPLPLNPLELDEHPLLPEVRICSALVEECWPAILATCSTFLYSALDSEYYHGLVRAFQRFAHVAGLLELSTPRDAFLTTLGKAAVPPNVLTACLNAGQTRPLSPNVPDTPQAAGSSKGLLSTDNVTVTSPSFDKSRQASFDVSSVPLNTRNLLCLRALLNLGIALGPTLSKAWRIILDTLQQADLVLYVTGKTGGRPSSASRGNETDSETGSLMANFGNEVRSVETAASRLLESTVDFPNEPFVEVLQAICDLLAQQKSAEATSPQATTATTENNMLSASKSQHKRAASFSLQSLSRSPQQDQFALTKLGDVAIINIERLLVFPPEESGWTILTNELIKALGTASLGAAVRARGAEILVKLALEAANMSANMPAEARKEIQIQVLHALQQAVAPFATSGRKASIADQTSDIDMHKIILDGLKAMMDDCGEDLVAGWEIAFEIIGSIFVVDGEPPNSGRGTIPTATNLSTKSPKLIRSAFSSLQLICSDFLTSLPRSCFLILVDTVYKFCSQDEDLNIALTTVTFFWVLSDFLSGKTGSLDITAKLMQGTDSSDLETLAGKEGVAGSDAALWMLLLLRLTTVASDDRLELRNSAIQTLLRIFDAYGDRLNPEAWSISVKAVIFELLTSLEGELRDVREDNTAEAERAEWDGTAVIVLDGMSTLLADYLDVLVTHPSFGHLWSELLSHLSTLLDFETLDVSTAVLKALGHILSQYSETDKLGHKKATVQSAWELWSRRIPVSSTSNGGDDNQPCLVAYLAAFKEVYRLCQADIDLQRIERMLVLLHETAETATVGSYASDTEHPTALQTQVLQSVQMIRTDIAGAPSAIITQASKFVLLAFDGDKFSRANNRRTFVALSKGSMQLLEGLISEHAPKEEIYISGAYASALSSLSKPVQLKYGFPVTTRSTSPWRMATTTSTVLIKAALPQLKASGLPAEAKDKIWSLIALITNGILSADCNEAKSSVDIDDDESFDVAAFEQLRELIIPTLGSNAVPSAARKAVANSLFQTSIVHPLAPGDRLALRDGVEAALDALKKPRAGRTTTVYPARRQRMAYVAFNELFSQSFANPATDQATEADLRIRIANVMAPFLVVRTALALRMYIADQPLRGRMPQPLSQRKELMWMLRKVVERKGEKGGLSRLGGEEAESKRHLLHVYPLLVQAQRVTADEKVTMLLREAMEAVGQELGL
ncbi:dimerization and cyclophilin-binding domain of mon2 domain-containing protein [Sarocladium implicatum]|nr:dimerization and cyclophilin-binding domain of mon2 domain-containing protein [Sarocladium implicatum]